MMMSLRQTYNTTFMGRYGKLMDLLEKICYIRWNTSEEHTRMHMSAQQGEEPTNLELQEKDHF